MRFLIAIIAGIVTSNVVVGKTASSFLGILAGVVAFLWIYRTERFTYRKKHGSWFAYFKGRPPSMSHVLHDNDGYYVCWDRPLYSKEAAKTVARHWMSTYG